MPSVQEPTIKELLDTFAGFPHKDINFFLGQGEIFQYWVVHHAVLDLYYSILTAALLASTELETRLKLIDTMVTLAAILKVIFIQCLAINEAHGEALRFTKEEKLTKEVQARLTPALRQNGSYPNLSSAESSPRSGQQKKKPRTSFEKWRVRFEKWCSRVAKSKNDSKILREFLLFWNWLRLCLIRVKKVLNAFGAFFKNTPALHAVVGLANKVLDPVFPFLSWILFIPRAFLQLYQLLNHSIPNYFKKKEDRKLEDLLKGTTRFAAQLYRRWFPLGNDWLWMIANIFICFMFGPAAPFVLICSIAFPVSTLITMALYIYDVVLIVIGAWIELERLSKVKKAFAGYGESVVLNERISFENKKIAWSVTIVLITLVGAIACFLLPIILPGAGIPFAGAFLLLTMSFVNRYFRENIFSMPKDGVYSGLEDAKEKLIWSKKKLIASQETLTKAQEPLRRQKDQLDEKTDLSPKSLKKKQEIIKKLKPIEEKIHTFFGPKPPPVLSTPQPGRQASWGMSMSGN